jgi:hypothetical protein
VIARLLTATALTLACIPTVIGIGSPPAGAADQVSGYVYRDLNNNGVKDADEPGVAGVVLRTSAGAFITDANGYYVVPDVSSTLKIRADAGWFRSQCTAAYSGPTHGSSYTPICPDPGSGAGADQDFTVDNQLLTAMVKPGGSASLGLTPDWVGDGYSGFSTDPANANSIDPAMRLSPGYRMPGADTDCLNDICRPGETQWVLVQWLNQGTAPLSKVSGVLHAPAYSTVTQIAIYPGHRRKQGQSVTGFGVFDAQGGAQLSLGANGWLSTPSSKVKILLHGRILPGSEYLLAVGFRLDDDAPFTDVNGDGLPDCSAATGKAYPGQTCTPSSDNAPGTYQAWGAVTHVRHGPDVDAVFCPHIPKQCPAKGVHDKTRPGDSNDSGGWQVDSTIPPT